MKGPSAAKIGLILTRVVVPAWVLTGALFKLYETSPRLLPRETILNLADRAGIDLYLLLAVLIGLELLAVAVMLCVARLARAMAIFVLSVFCLILLGEMVQGNFTSCGCLGASSPPPWAMLLIDGLLLLGVILFDPSPVYPVSPPKWPVGFALLLAIGGFYLSFTTVIPAGRARPEETVTPTPVPVITPPDPVTPDPAPAVDRTVNPDPAAVPGYWFLADMSVWIGKPWREVDLFRFMRTWPDRDLDSGKHYVVFYSRTCDHCEEMFIEDLIDPRLASMTVAVNVPPKHQRIDDAAWPMPQTDCETLDLPIGCDWIFTTPLALRIEDGIVTCATEGEHAGCMELR